MRAKKPGIHDESLRQKPVRLPDDLYVLAVSNTLKVLCSQITRFIAKNEKKGNGEIRLTRSSQSLLWHDSCWRRLALKLASLQQQQQPQPWRAPYVGRRSIRGHRSYTIATSALIWQNRCPSAVCRIEQKPLQLQTLIPNQGKFF